MRMWVRSAPTLPPVVSSPLVLLYIIMIIAVRLTISAKIIMTGPRVVKREAPSFRDWLTFFFGCWLIVAICLIRNLKLVDDRKLRLEISSWTILNILRKLINLHVNGLHWMEVKSTLIFKILIKRLYTYVTIQGEEESSWKT